MDRGLWTRLNAITRRIVAIQLQEFAKQVLFGTTIEEKLGFPRDEIIDTHPGSPIATPRTLSRPKHLKLREDGVKASHPSAAKLIDEKERGRLLHFFGNHELLATELMALAILKFPEAPASFRRGLLETLKDEQIHTRLYMHRMKQCGVEFGELPLNDYFWKSVSSMEDPLDYVTRLSLTFEQANLDYSREYKKLFDEVGDPSTAGILDKIYRDEIDHVGFGLKWFRRWKAEGKTDWEAYRERLSFPLSPARAKGNIYNAKGRSEAGLDKAFINDLQIFNRSRGRTPSVFWFNPDAEKFASRNSADGFELGSSTLQNDLEFLPAYLSRKDDILIVSESPSAEFLRQIQSFGFQLPEIYPCDDKSKEFDEAPHIPRKVGELRPWAWTPDSIAFFKKTFQSATRPPRIQSLWNDQVRSLFSKFWSAEFGRELAKEFRDYEWTAPEEVYGRSASNLDELSDLRNRFADLGYCNIVCKAPFGTAANGIRCIRENEPFSPGLLNWLDSIWDTQKSVVVEPWLDRVYDFSVQYEKRGEDISPIAFTRLVNNARGQFRGIVTNGFRQGIGSDLIRFLMTPTNGSPRVYHWFEDTIGPRLANKLGSQIYNGPLGIDAFVYRDPSDCLRLKSIVEINPRYTMGRIGHELEKRNAKGTLGYFQIISRSQIRKTDNNNFTDFCASFLANHPVKLTSDEKPRIVSGSFPLTDPNLAKQFLALYHVRESIADLPLKTIF